VPSEAEEKKAVPEEIDTNLWRAIEDASRN